MIDGVSNVVATIHDTMQSNVCLWAARCAGAGADASEPPPKDAHADRAVEIEVLKGEGYQ